jgi:type II secretion system protein D
LFHNIIENKDGYHILKLRIACLAISLILSLCIVPFAFAENGVQANPTEVKPADTGKAAVEAAPAKTPPAGIEKQPAEATPAGVKPAEPGKAATAVKPAEEKPGLQEMKHPPAEGAQPGADQPVPKTTAKKPAVPATPPQEQKKPETVSFFFDDADIFEVAQTVFADILKANYIIDPQVKGRVNFRTVTPIPKDEVLSVMDIIFRLNGIGYVEEGGIYRIVPLAEVSKELIYSQIGKPPAKVAIAMFTFKNLDLKESMPDIENALGLHLKGGTVRIIPIYRLNALIVVASNKDELEYIKQWVETFDAMFATARPKIFVYALQNSKAEHIASLLQSILSGTSAPTTGAAAPSKFAPTTRPGAGVIQPRTSFGTTGATGTAAGGAGGAGGTTAPASTAPKAGGGAAVISSGTFVSPDTKIFADEITNSLIVLATPADYKFIEETIKKIDIMPRQVSIEALIARVDLTDNLSFGFSWGLNTHVKISGIKPFTRGVDLSGDVAVNPGLVPNSTSGVGVPSQGFSFVGSDSKGNVRAMITALATESKAKILAAPHILVSDNRQAKIQVGSQIPIATSSTSYVNVSGQTTTEIPTTNTIQYQDIGIILTVTPQVNDSGLITLDISQEISSVGPPAVIGGTAYTSINKTEADTNLVARDGETIIIGGLIREDVTKSKDGIPFLSKIPIIGGLFGNTSDQTDRTELVILLTPHVIRNMEQAGHVTTDYVDRYKQTTKDKTIDTFIGEKSPKEKGDGNGETKKPE